MEGHEFARKVLIAHSLAAARVRMTGIPETVVYGVDLVEIFKDESGSLQARLVKANFQPMGF